MHLLKYFDQLSLRPENAKEIKDLILDLAIRGRLTEEWRLNNVKIAEKIQSSAKYEAPFKIPNSWRWTILSESSSINGGFAFKSSKYVNDGVRVIRISDFDENGFKDDKIKRYEYSSDLDRYQLENHNILMAMTGGTVGKTYFVENLSERMFVNQRVATIKIDKGVNPNYINYTIKTGLIQSVIHEAKNSTNDNISMRDIKNFKIPLPPFAEQKAIVQIVNQLMEEVDQLEAATTARVTLRQDFIQSSLHQLTTENSQQAWSDLQPHFKSFFDTEESIDKLKEAILQLAVQGKLTRKWREDNPDIEPASVLLERIKEEKAKLIKEKKIRKEKLLPEIMENEIPYNLPEEWIASTINEIANSTEAGKSPKCLNRPADENEWGVIKTTSVQKLKFEEDENKAYPQGFITGNQAEVKNLDLLITRAGPFNRTGIVAVAENPRKMLLLSDKTIRINFNKKLLSPHYIAIALSAGYSHNILQKLKSGMAKSQVNISQDKLKSVVVFLPPIEEQKTIVQLVNQLMDYCDQLKIEISRKNGLEKNFLQSSIREVIEQSEAIS